MCIIFIKSFGRLFIYGTFVSREKIINKITRNKLLLHETPESFWSIKCVDKAISPLIAVMLKAINPDHFLLQIVNLETGFVFFKDFSVEHITI